MISIYAQNNSLFKPPQQSQPQPQQASPQASQSPYDQAFGASQYGAQNLFPSQSAPSFSFGGSTFSISPSLPFGSLTGGGGGGGSQSQAPSGSHSPFSASFGSSINSPSSFGPLSSAPFLQNSMPSFAPATSYNAAFESANSGPLGVGNNGAGGPSGSFGGALGGGPSSGMHSQGGPSPSAASLSNQALMPQSSNSNPINSYSPIQAYNGQHDSSASQININQQHQQHQPQPQGGPMNQQSNLGAHSSAGPFGSQQHNQAGNQYASQQYRPDMMSIAASSSVPSSNSYCKY